MYRMKGREEGFALRFPIGWEDAYRLEGTGDSVYHRNTTLLLKYERNNANIRIPWEADIPGNWHGAVR